MQATNTWHNSRTSVPSLVKRLASTGKHGDHQMTRSCLFLLPCCSSCPACFICLIVHALFSHTYRQCSTCFTNICFYICVLTEKPDIRRHVADTVRHIVNRCTARQTLKPDFADPFNQSEISVALSHSTLPTKPSSNTWYEWVKPYGVTI